MIQVIIKRPLLTIVRLEGKSTIRYIKMVMNYHKLLHRAVLPLRAEVLLEVALQVELAEVLVEQQAVMELVELVVPVEAPQVELMVEELVAQVELIAAEPVAVTVKQGALITVNHRNKKETIIKHLIKLKTF